MQESFVFYRSFFEALKDMDKESQADCLMAIADYALNDVEPKLTPAVRMFFTLVKPQIDANKRRMENGTKGGRPRKPKNNLEITEEKPKQNLDETKIEPNVNYNLNNNLNINNKLVNFGELKKVCLTSDEYEKLKSKYGDLLEPAIEKLDGWIATTTKKIKKGSHYAYFKSDSCVWENLRPIAHGVCHDVPDTKREQENRLARMAELAKIENMKRVQQKYGV